MSPARAHTEHESMLDVSLSLPAHPTITILILCSDCGACLEILLYCVVLISKSTNSSFSF